MAENEEVYLSIPQGSYKLAKRDILGSQKSLLHSLKKLHNLTILSRRKSDLKLQLKRDLSVIYNNIKSIQDNSPKPNIPKRLQKEVEKKKEELEEEIREDPKERLKQSMEKKFQIEHELKTIQDKLKNLNG